MKSLLRNLMFVARRYRLSVVLNLLGLTAAFMVFVALLMQIDYDRSYNAALADADRIAMPCNIPPKDSDFEKFSAMSFPIMELIGGQPHVESYTYILGDCYEETFYINEHFCSGTLMMCAPNFADFYKLDIVVGDKKCLDANQVMIPESFAKKYFGDASPLGKSINKAKTWIVGAVYRDIHAKKHMAEESCAQSNRQIVVWRQFDKPQHELVHNVHKSRQSGEFPCNTGVGQQAV